jgi:hypothetical protein
MTRTDDASVQAGRSILHDRHLRLTGDIGQGLAEYGLILALVAIAAVVAMTSFGGQITTALANLGINL